MGGHFEIRHGPPRTTGFVLISVLWILAILTVVGLGFGRRAMMERQMARYALDHQQAMQLARGAVESAIAELLNRNALNERDGLKGFTGLAQHWAQPVNLFEDGRYYSEPGEDYAEEICMYRIHDCDGRISLNHAPEKLLMAVPGLTLQGVATVTARRTSLDPENQPQRFMHINDLRTVQDIDDSLWYGPAAGEGLRDMLTVWGGREGRVNINTAPPAVIRVIPGLRSDVAEAIIGYRIGPDGELGTRDDRGFRSLDEVAHNIGVGATRVATLYKYCKTDSDFFTIRAIATRRKGRIRATCTATVAFSGGITIVEWRENDLDA